ncbi:hypothetical protein Tco_0088596, partial [Tanacetum coccineum]
MVAIQCESNVVPGNELKALSQKDSNSLFTLDRSVSALRRSGNEKKQSRLRGKQTPPDKGLPATVLDEGTSKTKPLPEGPQIDNDVFEAGDEMDEDIQQADVEETQSPKPSKDTSTKVPTEEPV